VAAGRHGEAQAGGPVGTIAIAARRELRFKLFQQPHEARAEVVCSRRALEEREVGRQRRPATGQEVLPLVFLHQHAAVVRLERRVVLA
jgi:hypothetical protein